MPPAPEINNCYRVLLEFGIGDAFLGQTHVDFRAGTTVTWGDAFASDLTDMISTAILSNDVNDGWSTEVTLRNYRVENLDDRTQAPIDIPTSVAGVESGDPLPEQVAALVSLRSGLTGRSNRGRAYWCGYTEASADGSILNPTTAGHIADMYADFQTGWASLNTGGVLAIVSIKNATSHAVASITVEPTFATMRPRLERLR